MKPTIEASDDRNEDDPGAEFVAGRRGEREGEPVVERDVRDETDQQHESSCHKAGAQPDQNRPDAEDDDPPVDGRGPGRRPSGLDRRLQRGSDGEAAFGTGHGADGIGHRFEHTGSGPARQSARNAGRWADPFAYDPPDARRVRSFVGPDPDREIRGRVFRDVRGGPGHRRGGRRARARRPRTARGRRDDFRPRPPGRRRAELRPAGRPPRGRSGFEPGVHRQQGLRLRR